MLQLDSRVCKNARTRWRLIDGEAVLLDEEEGDLIRLNGVGAEIWAAIDGRRPVAAILAHICSTFDVSERRAKRDVERFIRGLLRQELIHKVTEDAPRR